MTNRKKDLVRNADAPRTGFEMIPNRSTRPFLTIDSQQRLYISRPARGLIGLPRGDFDLLAGYDHDHDYIVLRKPQPGGFQEGDQYSFDKRAYSRVNYFVERAQLQDKLPLRFVYIMNPNPGLYREEAFVFEIDGFYDGGDEENEDD